MTPRLSRRRLLAWGGAATTAAVGVAVGGCTPRVVVPEPERYIATVGESSVAITLEQAHYAAIIAGISIQLGLVPRAASIALATAYQESGIRNLDYGDRDSLGLFQQRPSQGWGTEKQVMDPYYSTKTFYAALVKVDGWQVGDINDVAQAVQRSGVPDGYRKHVSNARILASALTGETPAAFSGLDRREADGTAKQLVRSVERSIGVDKAKIAEQQITFSAGNTDRAWAVAAHAVAHTGTFGVDEVAVGRRVWTRADDAVPTWSTRDEPVVGSGKVLVTLADPADAA